MGFSYLFLFFNSVSLLGHFGVWEALVYSSAMGTALWSDLILDLPIRCGTVEFFVIVK